jgi:hypothetical protein
MTTGDVYICGYSDLGMRRPNYAFLDFVLRDEPSNLIFRELRQPPGRYDACLSVSGRVNRIGFTLLSIATFV